MASKKQYSDIDLNGNSVVKLRAETVLSLPAVASNDKRIVYYNGDYYYCDGSGWILMANIVPTGGTTGQVLAKATDTDYDLEWVDQTGGGGSGIPFAIASGTDTYTATVTGVTAYTDGDAYLIRFTNGNTTSATLNINSIGAIPLYRNNDGALIGGDIVNGGEMLCVYNSTSNAFQAIGTAPNTLLSYVTNDDTVTLTKGMPVYAFSGTGDRMTVKRASNVGDSTSAQTVGLVLSTSIGVNQKGFIMMQGLLDGLSILPTATFADGDAIYLGATPGTITNVKPYAPNHLVYLGVVTTAGNGSSGRMYVRVQNGYELDELHNVQAQSPNLKDTLWYDSSVSPGQWKTSSISTILGYTPENSANKSTDTNLGTSNTLYPTQNAVKVYTDNLLGNANALVYKGVIDCSTNPNYPAADAGFMYIASVAGKIGGASGIDVEVGDMIICNTDGTVSGNQATVGSYWNIIQKNIVGAVTGPASSVNNNVAFFDGVTGKIIKDSGLGLSGTNTGDETQATIKTKLGSASSSTDGYLSSTDWSTFNSKIGGSGTTNEISYFTASGTIASLTTATYPSLTELSYVKGVTSAIQTQIDNTYIARVQSVVSAATVTPTFANDEVIITAQAVNLTLANPTGTATEGKSLIVRIKDDGTTRSITFDTQYRAVNVNLPTSTTANRTLYLGMIYNDTDTRWDVTGVALENANPDNTVQLLYYSNNC